MSNKEILLKEFYWNMFEQHGILKVFYYKFFKKTDFVILTAEFVYGWYGMHLEMNK